MFYVVDSEAQTIFQNGARLNAEWNEISIMTREDDKVFGGEPVIVRSHVALLGRHDGSYSVFWEYRTKGGKLIDFEDLERLARLKGVWKPELGGLEGIAIPKIISGKCEVSKPKF